MFRSASSVMGRALLELVGTGPELANAVGEVADDPGNLVVVADLDLDGSDPLRLDAEPVERLHHVHQPLGGEGRALDEVALVVVARLAPHEEDPVDAR